MFKPLKTFTLVLLTAALAGCGLFRVEIQQGNFISNEQVAQLEEGMTKREVRYIMGTPLVVDPFHEKTRWDYVYSYSPNLGADVKKRRVTLFFQDDTLERIIREMGDTNIAEVSEESGGTRVTSPTQASEKGFFKRTWDGIFGDDEE